MSFCTHHGLMRDVSVWDCGLPYGAADSLLGGAWIAASQGAEEEDIGAQLGVGSVSADADLDLLKEAAETELLKPQVMLGKLAQVIATFCHNRCLHRTALLLPKQSLPFGLFCL